MPLTAAKGAKKKADDIFSKLIRSRGHCENCGATENLQCAHIVSRRYSATRTDLNNAFCLCARCHFYFTDWPIVFAEFVVDKIGTDAYQRLQGLAEAGACGAFRVDWPAEVERLRPLLAAVNQ